MYLYGAVPRSSSVSKGRGGKGNSSSPVASLALPLGLGKLFFLIWAVYAPFPLVEQSVPSCPLPSVEEV